MVSHRQHLKQTELIQGRVTSIDHANRTAVVAPADGGAHFEVSAAPGIVLTQGPEFELLGNTPAVTRSRTVISDGAAR